MRLLILYGSETGNAQDVAELIWRSSKKYNYTGPVLACDDYKICNLINEKIVIFVCSTTGQGDQPKNMQNFWKFLLRKNLPENSLINLKYGVLGLGDSKYECYNYVAKKLYKRLKQLSGQSILSLGLCNDQHDYGIYGTLYQWLDELWKQLDVTSYQINNNYLTNPTITAPTSYQYKMNIIPVDNNENNINWSDNLNILKWPYQNNKNYQNYSKFQIIENKRITDIKHFQDVRHIKLKYPKNLYWQPFDVLYVRPCNSDENVEKFFTILNNNRKHNSIIDPEIIIQCISCDTEMVLPDCYESPTKLKYIVKYVWDLTAIPRQHLFELLAINCLDDLEKDKLLELASPQGCDDCIKYINRTKRTILEVLYDFPNAVSQLNLQILFELFHIIQLRAFSIASIPETQTLDLLVAIVEYKTILTDMREGLCTKWLKNLQKYDEIYGIIIKGTMNIPQNYQYPLIMIGPGTGIAPFRSYILKLEYDYDNGIIENMKKLPKIIVIFGCRSRYLDFYFQDDYQRLIDKNLIQCFYAFSRDQKEKFYVQNIILEQQILLSHEILLKNAYVLIAGNANNMPKQVREAFHEIIGNRRYLDEIMLKKNRYQEEVWY